MSNDSCKTTNVSHIEYLVNQLTLARREISNLRQQLKTHIHVYKKECEDINRKLENWRCLECRSRQNTQDNEVRVSENHNDVSSDVDLPLKYIGVISTHFPEKRGTPRQPGICPDMIAKLTLNNEIFTNPSHALEGLQEFSHMWILFHFHKNDSTHIRAKVSPPRLNGVRTGVFATRSPHRPCPIGLSLVRIDRIMDSTIYFSGVDMVDQTPVLDMKPYIPQYDNPTLTNLPYQHDLSYDHLQSTSDFTSPVVDIGDHLNDSQPSTSSTSNLDFVTEELDNMNIRVMDGEENNRRQDDVLGAVSNHTNNRQLLEESFYSRSSSRMGEREAPDGEEEESPSQPQTLSDPVPVVNTPDDQIRVPSWINQPPVHSLTVTFKNRALIQLQELNSEGEEKKRIITNILREDPRSVYLRERWSSHCYVFRIAGLYVYCAFNDTQHTVTVYQVFQNTSSECDD